MSLLSAKLILFKVADFININSVKFSVYPLCDYFSSFTTFKNPCKINPTLKHDFKPFTKNAVIEIDITDIVSKWMDNSLPNKGLVIVGNPSNNNLSLTAFGSAYNKNNTIIPFLSLIPLFPLPIPSLKYSVSIFPECH